jgi:hypothetical protein
MNDALGNVMHQLQLGEELIADAIDVVIRRWQASTQAIGKICTGPERWQAAIRQMQAPINLAEILRARTLV